MSTLIDLCGTPINLEHISNFRLIKRDCIYYPAYQEIPEQTFSIFARKNAENKKKFQFVKMVPFGIVLSNKEKPLADSYEIKSFGEAATFSILAEMGKALGNAANLAADALRIDTSGNTELRILTQGRRLINIKYRDIPAKVAFLSGKVSDVYKNDPNYDFLGESISPTTIAVQTLVVTANKTTHVFFGGGIDIDDAEALYHSLLETYNSYQESLKSKNIAASPKLNVNIPKFSIPSIKVQSPFVIKKNSSTLSETLQIPETIDVPEEE